MHAATDSHSDGISYRKKMPLRWTTLTELPGVVEAERYAEANARVLAAVALLEEHVQVGDEPSPHELELQRIHQKLNLLIEMFGGFLSQQITRPEETPVRLSWRNISWDAPASTSSGSLAIGTLGLVELQLSAMLPQMLRLPARIVANHDGVVSAEFDTLGEVGQRALERHVFMWHRREVAETRQPARYVARENRDAP